MIRGKRDNSLDPQFEPVDDGGLIEGRPDMGERNRHRGRAVVARGFHRAADAPPLTLLAKRAGRRNIFALKEQVGCLVPLGSLRSSSNNGDEMSINMGLAVTR
jgi:hypothetical protein